MVCPAGGRRGYLSDEDVDEILPFADFANRPQFLWLCYRLLMHCDACLRLYKIFIDNIPESATDDEVKKLAEDKGGPVSCRFCRPNQMRLAIAMYCTDVFAVLSSTEANLSWCSRRWAAFA